MNKEQAIEIIETHSENISSSSLVGRALDIAIDALKAQLSSEGTTSDMISRQQALNALIYAVKNVGILDADDIRTVFKALPTIQPEPTDEQVAEYCKRRCLHIVTDDFFHTAQPEPKVEFHNKDHVWIDGKQYISLRRFQEAVKEAQPKEGHWKKDEKDDCPPVFRRFRICSVCGAIETSETNYCPNCGARMIKGGEPDV